MAKTYEDWAKKIIRKHGVFGARKLMEALEKESSETIGELNRLINRVTVTGNLDMEDSEERK
jgi:hypothetical protein